MGRTVAAMAGEMQVAKVGVVGLVPAEDHYGASLLMGSRVREASLLEFGLRVACEERQSCSNAVFQYDCLRHWTLNAEMQQEEIGALRHLQHSPGGLSSS